MYAFDWASNVELIWRHPVIERFLRRLASFSRLIVFDTRGMGLSDPIEELAPVEEWMDDVRSVMETAGSERAAIVGHGHAEVELRDGDIGGIAVHIGARVASLTGPGEVLVSSTVKDLVAGSGLTSEDRGVHELRGVPRG